MTLLYHAKLGLPPTLVKPDIGRALHYSHHAQCAALTDGLDLATLPPTLPSYELIEAGMEGRSVSKWVVRVRYSTRYDLVLALANDYTVKTVWLNAVDDQHTTLDASKYQRFAINEEKAA